MITKKLTHKIYLGRNKSKNETSYEQIHYVYFAEDQGAYIQQSNAYVIDRKKIRFSFHFHAINGSFSLESVQSVEKQYPSITVNSFKVT